MLWCGRQHFDVAKSSYYERMDALNEKMEVTHPLPTHSTPLSEHTRADWLQVAGRSTVHYLGGGAIPK